MTDLDPEARRLLDMTRAARTPTAGDRARMDRLLAGSLAIGAASTAHAGSAAAATKTAGTALGVKLAASVAVAAAFGTAGYFGWNARQAPAEAATKPAVEQAAPAKVESPPAVEIAPVVIPPGQRADEPRSDARRSARTPAEGTLLEELNLLHEAQARWRKGDASGALSLLSEHRARFPKSQVVPERDALTVLSLCSMNRTVEAKKVAKRFLRTAPRSPLRTSVEESCAGLKDGTE